MEASNFFTRLLRQPQRAGPTVEPDDLGAFDKAWQSVRVGCARLDLAVRPLIIR